MARLSLKSPAELLAELGERARHLRLHRNVPQAELAARADVPLRTLQRFERTGRASTVALVRIAFALGAEESLAALFPRPEPATLDEVLHTKEPARQRARRPSKSSERAR